MNGGQDLVGIPSGDRLTFSRVELRDVYAATHVHPLDDRGMKSNLLLVNRLAQRYE